MSKILAIDIEASGFSGYPIEIGWAGLGEDSYESFLIRPDETWDIAATWDPVAEDIHGISLDQLMAEGIPAFRALEDFQRAIEGATLFSDAPAFDSRWLQLLYDLGIE